MKEELENPNSFYFLTTDHAPDRQECLNEDFSVYETRIDRYLSGYVRDPASDYRCLKDFIAVMLENSFSGLLIKFLMHFI